MSTTFSEFNVCPHCGNRALYVESRDDLSHASICMACGYNLEMNWRMEADHHGEMKYQLDEHSQRIPDRQEIGPHRACQFASWHNGDQHTFLIGFDHPMTDKDIAELQTHAMADGHEIIYQSIFKDGLLTILQGALSDVALTDERMAREQAEFEAKHPFVEEHATTRYHDLPKPSA